MKDSAMDTFPDEIWLQIANYTMLGNPYSLLSLALSCRRFGNIVRDTKLAKCVASRECAEILRYLRTSLMFYGGYISVCVANFELGIADVRAHYKGHDYSFFGDGETSEIQVTIDDASKTLNDHDSVYKLLHKHDAVIATVAKSTISRLMNAYMKSQMAVVAFRKIERTNPDAKKYGRAGRRPVTRPGRPARGTRNG